MRIKHESKAKLVSYIFSNSKGANRYLTIILVCSLITNVITILLSVVNKQLFDGYEFLNSSNIVTIMIVLFSSYLLMVCLNFINQCVQTGVNNKLKINMQLGFYKTIQSLDYSFFQKNHSNDYFYRMFGDISSVMEYYIKLVIDAPIRIVTFLITLYLMLSWSLELTAIAVLLVIVQWLVTLVFIRPLNKNLKIFKEQEQHTMSNINLDFQQMDTVRSLSLEEYKYIETEKVLQKYCDKNLRQVKTSAFYGESISLVNSFGGVIILIFGLYQVKMGSITLGTVMAFSLLVTYFSASIAGLIGLFTKYQQSNVSFNRLREFMDKIDKRITRYHEKLDKNYDIKIRGLDFSYDNKVIYSNFNLDINQGEMILIRGDNGAGKTTLCKILVRFLYPQSGTVFVGEKNIEDLDIQDFRSICVLMGQAIIFEDTLRKNLDPYGNYSDDEINAIISSCNLSDLISNRRLSLSDNVILKESEFSQGERQKLSIARVLIKQPKILILDEPTANLDEYTANQIINNLKDFSNKNRGTIIITSHDPRVDNLVSRKIFL